MPLACPSRAPLVVTTERFSRRAARAGVRIGIAALLAGALHSPAQAWSNNPNLGTPVLVAPGDQGATICLADGNGGAFVSWTAGVPGAYDTFIQHLDATGARLWGASGVVVSAAPDDQAATVLALDAIGGVFVAWSDHRSTTSYDIYAQHFNSAGVAQWAVNGTPIATGTGEQLLVKIVADIQGGVLLAWNDSRAGNYDIYGQHVKANGSLSWTANGLLICNAAGDQNGVGLRASGDGAIFTWVDARVAAPDIYAQLVDGAGTIRWAANGVPVCSAAGQQGNVQLDGDGVGGAYFTWEDYRGGASPEVYANHLDASGAQIWPADGILVTPSSSALSPVVVNDGVNGCILAWQDYRNVTAPDLYAQRLTAGGAALWTAGGTAVCVATDDQTPGPLVADGLGGAIVTWEDRRLGFASDLYAQRITGDGSALWAANGRAYATAAGDQYQPSPTSDGAGGILVSFSDRRGPDADVYAMRIERFGQLANPEPRIASVRDVLNDEGGFVRVGWTRSYLDAGPGSTVNEYRLWREVPAAAAQALLARRGAGALRTTRANAAVYYWELVGSQPANGFAAYSLVAATAADSVGGANPATRFMVEAVQTASGWYWDSPPDSGYSADNLAPPAPSPFAGIFTPSATQLDWGASSAADVAFYRLYRGTSSSFVPGPANRIAEVPGTSHTDAAGVPFWYKVSAVDVHGNEGAFATALPAGALGADAGALPREFALGPAAPNPARGAVTMALALPRAAAVRAGIYDQQGRLVRVLTSADWPAGSHALTWDGRTSAGSEAPAGLYFLRAEAAGRRMSGRVTIVR